MECVGKLCSSKNEEEERLTLMPRSPSDCSVWVQHKVQDSAGYLGDIQRYVRHSLSSLGAANVELDSLSWEEFFFIDWYMMSVSVSSSFS